MQTIQQHYRELGREPTDIELETIAQTWSEHCSHKTLTGRVTYTDENGDAALQEPAEGDDLRRDAADSAGAGRRRLVRQRLHATTPAS